MRKNIYLCMIKCKECYGKYIKFEDNFYFAIFLQPKNNIV